MAIVQTKPERKAQPQAQSQQPQKKQNSQMNKQQGQARQNKSTSSCCG